MDARTVRNCFWERIEISILKDYRSIVGSIFDSLRYNILSREVKPPPLWDLVGYGGRDRDNLGN